MADTSDRKSSDLLIAKLFGKQITPTKMDKPHKDFETPIKQRLRRKRFTPQSNKITGWCSKEKLLKELAVNNDIKPKLGKSVSEGNNSQTDDKLNKYNNKKGKKKKEAVKFEKSESFDSDSSANFQSFEKKSKKKKVKFERSDSFEKYGVIMPSIDEIMKEKMKFEEQKRQWEEVKSIEDVSLDLTFTLKPEARKEKVSDENVLSCKHLSMAELSKIFNTNKTYLNDIISGNCYSERHTRFHNQKVNSNSKGKDLTYNTSMIVFSYDQIEHMMDLLSENFDSENDMTRYFFMVLLPELCTKIFMEVHNMSYEEALMYLDTRPLDN